MRSRRFIVLAVVAVLAAACGSSSSKKGENDTGSKGGATTYTVLVDHKGDGTFNLATTAYFPSKLTVHAGDTIDFKSVFTGEPHTVTLGKLVDAGVPKALAAGPNATEEPAELAKLPALLPDGPGDANQMAANPCFLASGEPAADKACAKVDQPAFDASQMVYSSGFLPDSQTFEVKLAPNLAPGNYHFMCLLHRAGMTGEITVVAKTDKAQTADAVTAAGAKEAAGITKKLKPVADGLEGGTLPPFVTAAKPGNVIVGGASQDVQNGLIANMGPKSLKVKVGESVVFTFVGPHTVSFNAPEDLASSIMIKGPDGAWHANQQAAQNAGGWPAQPQSSGPPPSGDGPPPPPQVLDAGSFDGTGFHSTGVYVSFPPQLFGVKVTFTKAGTFQYKCIIHPDMEGEITVG